MNLEQVTRRKPEAWPFYVVCDVSNSMWRTGGGPGPTPWEVIDEGLMQILNEIDKDATARNLCRLSIIVFGQEVDTLLPLTPFQDDESLVIPGQLPKQIWTNYAVVFEHLSQRVQADFETLERDHDPKHPVVFLITDGRPEVEGKTQAEDQWLPHLESLKTQPSKPIMVALGLGRALTDTIRKIPSDPGIGCVAENGKAPGELLGAIIDSIILSITRSVMEGFVFPTPPGMKRIV